MQGKVLGRPACPENMGQHDKGSRPQSSPTCFPPAGEGALWSLLGTMRGQLGCHTPATPPSPAGQPLPEQVSSKQLQQTQGFCVAEENRNHPHNTSVSCGNTPTFLGLNRCFWPSYGHRTVSHEYCGVPLQQYSQGRHEAHSISRSLQDHMITMRTGDTK